MRRTRRRKETTPRSCWGRELAAPPCSPTEPEWVCVCVFAWLNKWLVGVSRFRIGDSPVTSRALGLFSSSEILDLFVWEDENQNFVPNWIQSWRCLSLTPRDLLCFGWILFALAKKPAGQTQTVVALRVVTPLVTADQFDFATFAVFR